MSWVKGSDNSGSHPMLMDVAALADADERSVNEVMGFVYRLGTFSGAHDSDYVVQLGHVHMVGGPRWEQLVRQAVDVGLMAVEEAAGRRVYRVCEVPDFLHLRKSEEIEWERARKRDTNNPDLTAQVRLRDGDACRYCGEVVSWTARRGNRAGTYDHRKPGQAARTARDLVVACQRCNARRKDNPKADDFLPLLPAPTDPHYSPGTVQFLADRGYPVDKVKRTGPRPGTDTARPATARPDHQSENAQARAERPAPDPAGGDELARPGNQPDTAPTSGSQIDGQIEESVRARRRARRGSSARSAADDTEVTTP